MPDLSITQTGLLLAAVGLVAVLYSSVGHGGATGYLAVAALCGLSPAVARAGALWLNCCVAGIAFWRFQRAGFFDAHIFWPLAAASVPLAWLGSQVHLDGRLHGLLLGAALLAAGWVLGWGKRDSGEGQRRPLSWPVVLLVGGVLGWLAGLTGIGGGVFLTPLLIFLRWTPAKVAGGISALFILVNSLAGLAGLGPKALIWQPGFVGAVGLAAAGAWLGTQQGVNRWKGEAFRRALAGVLWIAAAKLLLTGK
ncbi:MAG TPA: sulfite exporter TauE/SafE family protein [Candidatus Paceibacterota bacterium]|nr:sulfite exporter TauE/SafE family protein [Kiritimatiellia bacterium]HRT56095.1 sulfite exporter TauE/SafE family protein [Candidatus Paceibacterota bacterium]